jgi:hypothetical protein
VRALPFGFVAPPNAIVGSIVLATLLTALTDDDTATLTALRATFTPDAITFDAFVAALRAHDVDALAALEPTCGTTASVLRALFLAEAGALGSALTVRNHRSDLVRAAPTDPHYAGSAALLREAARALQHAGASVDAANTPHTAMFRYVVGYPRSGNTLLLQFLEYAFDAPPYSVYPAAGRLYADALADTVSAGPIFVKDHVARPAYFRAPIISPVRDGRTALISLARYLYAEGTNPFVRRGEMTAFIDHVHATMPYGFWSDHVRSTLDARDRGADIRIVRYEEIAGPHAQRIALARELNAGQPAPHEDEPGFHAFVAQEKQRLASRPEWSENVPLPSDTFIPNTWSIGANTIDWHAAFDAPARRRFHDLGGTEALIRLGYETDENWWR